MAVQRIESLVGGSPVDNGLQDGHKTIRSAKDTSTVTPHLWDSSALPGCSADNRDRLAEKWKGGVSTHAHFILYVNWKLPTGELQFQYFSLEK